MKKEILLMIACTVFIAFGQLFLKLAGTRLEWSLTGTLLNWAFYAGICSAGLGAIFMTLAFRGGDLSTLYPFVSLGFVWTTIIAIMIFGETFMVSTGIGIVLIIAGVIMLGRSGVGA